MSNFDVFEIIEFIVFACLYHITLDLKMCNIVVWIIHVRASQVTFNLKINVLFCVLVVFMHS